MSANSVSPPQDGITRPDSNEYLAVTGRKELSECQSRSPSLNSQFRSSADMGRPSGVKLERSAIPAPRRRSPGLRTSPGVAYFSSLPKCSVNANCCASVSGWSRKTSTPCFSMPASIAATSSGARGAAQSTPVTRPAKPSGDRSIEIGIFLSLFISARRRGRRRCSQAERGARRRAPGSACERFAEVLVK